MQREQQNNLELDLKKRARRRLVGAIALILLLLIALPMLLKQPEDKQAANDDVKITFSDEPAPVADVPAPAESTAEPKLPADAAEEAGQESLDQPKEESKIYAKEIAIAMAPSPVAKPAEKQQALDAKTQAQPQSKPEVNSNEKLSEKSAEKPLEAKPENKVKSNSGERFFVQVGVFSELENVKRLQAKLKEIGFSSVHETVKTDKGNKIRLKTTLFESRDKAAAALDKIKTAGLTGMVVSQP